MKNIKLTFVTILIALSTMRCSTYRMSEEVQAQNIKAQPVADTPEEIAMRASEIFSKSPNLSDEQKEKIHAIYTNVYNESMTIRREIGQSKSLLYETLVKPDYKSSEINSLKKKIVALDKKRLDIMFVALKDVQKIVGRGVDKENIYRQLSEYDKNR